jgi:hypothetical protein
VKSLLYLSNFNHNFKVSMNLNKISDLVKIILSGALELCHAYIMTDGAIVIGALQECD